jgi:predicted transcriptional regulator
MPATPTLDAVAETLAAHPEAVAAAIAEAAGLGRSTTAKALAALEAAGRAERHPGPRAGGRRQPDRWTPAEARPAARADRPPKGSEKPQAPGRLSRGELAGLVAEHLSARPEEALTPSAVAKELGRSAGAVANALARLAGAGEVAEVSSAPRRYSARPAEIAS